MQVKAAVGSEGLFFSSGESCVKELRQLLGLFAANLTRDKEHGVLHGGEADAMPVPEAAVEEDIEVHRHEAKLAVNHLLRVAGDQGRQEHLILRGKAEPCIEVDVF